MKIFRTESVGKLDTLIYGNGLEVRYIYDILDRISEIQYNIGENGSFETIYSYTYDSAGNIFSVTDHPNQEATVYKYDSQGRLDQYSVYDTESYLNLYGSSVIYDEDSRVSMVFHTLDYSCPADNYHGTTYYNYSYYSYNYDTDTGHLSTMRLNGDSISGTIKPQYDAFGRTTQRIVDISTNPGDDFYDYQRVDTFYDKWTFTYTENYGDQTGQIASATKETRKGENTALLSSVGYRFTYDDNGNITQIANSSGVIQNKYYYDDLGQLIREDNRARNCSIVYEYDNAGNITAKKKYAFTTGTLGSVQATYTYSYNDSSWGDLLTSYDSTTIVYDEIGNPVRIGNYNAANDVWWDGYDLTWVGRQLVSYAAFDGYGTDELTYSAPVTFTYNADGIRTSKTVYGIEHKYYLHGSQITAEMWTQNNVEYLLYYLYDENGAPIGLQYRTSNYASGVFDFFFDKNLQGDVIGIYASDGYKICTYAYDAWGVCTVSIASGTSSLEKSIASTYNPFRYRGYYYDTQTGFYYLQSRYYNPEWGRWLNLDVEISGYGGDIRGYNLFVYCFNNPINMHDHRGQWPQWLKNGVKWVAQNIVMPVVNTVENALSNVDATFSRGINISGSPSGFIFNLQIGISMDTKGNIAIQSSVGGGFTGGSPGFSITAYQSTTNAPNINYLEGSGYQIGGSAGFPVHGIPVAVGGDFNIIPDAYANSAYFGATTNIGFGTPGGEFHVEWSETATWGYSQFNIFDVAEKIYTRIMEW